MEAIYVNAEDLKYDISTPSTNHTGQRSSKRSFYLVLILSLGLLSVFLLVGLITLGVYYLDSSRDSAELLSATNNQLSSMTEKRDLLNASLSAVSNQLSSMTEERDRLTGKTKELEKLLCLANQDKTCPSGWSMFNCSCYLLSESSGSWNAARNDCREREADLIVIDSCEEQMFLTMLTQGNTWIGLNDIEQEGQWKWVDGTPLTLKYWAKNEPNNMGTANHDEDCAHVKSHDWRTWNDCSCTASMKWICEKIP